MLLRVCWGVVWGERESVKGVNGQGTGRGVDVGLKMGLVRICLNRMIRDFHDKKRIQGISSASQVNRQCFRRLVIDTLSLLDSSMHDIARRALRVWSNELGLLRIELRRHALASPPFSLSLHLHILFVRL